MSYIPSYGTKNFRFVEFRTTCIPQYDTKSRHYNHGDAAVAPDVAPQVHCVNVIV